MPENHRFFFLQEIAVDSLDGYGSEDYYPAAIGIYILDMPVASCPEDRRPKKNIYICRKFQSKIQTRFKLSHASHIGIFTTNGLGGGTSHRTQDFGVFL
jgi:hypothetical protein